MSLGSETTASGTEAYAIGANAAATGPHAVSIGSKALAVGDNALAFGSYSVEKKKDENTGKDVEVPNITMATGKDSIALGTSADAYQEAAISIGRNTKTTAADSIALGDGTEVYNTNAIGAGNGARVWGNDGLAIGTSSSAGTSAIALGKSASAWGSDGIAIGEKTNAGNNSTAVGNSANAWTNDSVAIGANAAVSDEKAINATALGNGAIVATDHGIALGSGSQAATAAGVAGWDFSANAASTNSAPAWLSSWGALSIGDGTHTRQITGVAAGTRDTDAVNVAQLKNSIVSISAGDGITVSHDGLHYTISTNIKGSHSSEDDITVEPEKTKNSGTENQNKNKNSGASGAKRSPGMKFDNELPSTPSNPSGPQPGQQENNGGTGEQGGSSGTNPDKKPNSGKESGNPVVIREDIHPVTIDSDNGKGQVSPGETFTFNGDNKNISTSVSGKVLTIAMSDNIKVDSVTANTVTADTVTAKTVTSDSYKVGDKTYIDKNGLNANGNKITNVGKGEQDTDAVNVSQLKEMQTRDNQQVNELNNRISNLDSRVDKVGAGAAALAALHPQDFNPDDKWDVAAGFGSYRSANAFALGAFYRPDDRTLFSVGGSMGNGENMVNVGLTLKLGKNNPYSGMNRQEMLSRLAHDDRELADQKEKITTLEAKNKNYEDRIAKLEAAVEKLTAKI